MTLEIQPEDLGIAFQVAIFFHFGGILKSHRKFSQFSANTRYYLGSSVALGTVFAYFYCCETIPSGKSLYKYFSVAAPFQSSCYCSISSVLFKLSDNLAVKRHTTSPHYYPMTQIALQYYFSFE